jgi:hypothetical protein
VDAGGESLYLVTALIIKKRDLAGHRSADQPLVIEATAGHGRSYGLAFLREIPVSAKFACRQLS